MTVFGGVVVNNHNHNRILYNVGKIHKINQIRLVVFKIGL